MRGAPTLHSCATKRCMICCELSVRKKVSLPVQQSALSHATCEIRSECDVDCLLSSEDQWHVYLLKHHKCRIKEGSKIATSVKLWAAIRGIERGKNVLVMFGFKLKKMSQSAITCGLRRAYSGTRSVHKRPLKSSATHSIKIHSHERCKKAQRTVFTET